MVARPCVPDTHSLARSACRPLPVTRSQLSPSPIYSLASLVRSANSPPPTPSQFKNLVAQGFTSPPLRLPFSLDSKLYNMADKTPQLRPCIFCGHESPPTVVCPVDGSLVARKAYEELTLTEKRALRVPPVKAHDVYLDQDRIETVGALIWSADERLLLIKHLDDHLDRDLGYVFPTYRKFVDVRLPPDENDDQFLRRVIFCETGLTCTIECLAWVDRTTPGRVTRYHHATVNKGSTTRYNKDKKFMWVDIQDVSPHMHPPAPSNLADLISESLILPGEGIQTLDSD